MEISHDLVRSPAMQRGNYNKRCAIISAATAVFVRDGFIGASIDAIADEAGVSRQTIYNQIGDKEKLFAEVVRGINEQGSARLIADCAFCIQASDLPPPTLSTGMVTFGQAAGDGGLEVQ